MFLLKKLGKKWPKKSEGEECVGWKSIHVRRHSSLNTTQITFLALLFWIDLRLIILNICFTLSKTVKHNYSQSYQSKKNWLMDARINAQLDYISWKYINDGLNIIKAASSNAGFKFTLIGSTDFHRWNFTPSTLFRSILIYTLRTLLLMTAFYGQVFSVGQTTNHWTGSMSEITVLFCAKLAYVS